MAIIDKFVDEAWKDEEVDAEDITAYLTDYETELKKAFKKVKAELMDQIKDFTEESQKLYRADRCGCLLLLWSEMFDGDILDEKDLGGESNGDL